ncbi:hypothetical protein ACOSQ4_025482 [Xanthoceras sorbifolium]
MRMPVRTRNLNTFCAYHNELGHNTVDCFELKDAIEELIWRGRLGDYVVRPRNRPQQ